MRHHAADVSHSRLDLREDRRPGGRGDAAHQDLALADVGDLVHGLHHAGGTFHDAGRSRRADQLGGVRILGARPLLHALRSHAPEHDRHRVRDHFGGDAHGRRRGPVGQLGEQLLAPGRDWRPVARPARRTPGGPAEHELVERAHDLMAAKLEDVLGVLQEAVPRKQLAELAQLVPPAREEPVVAEELVLLHVREHRA